MRREGLRRSGMPMIGVSSLLTVFAVLCITVFAILSISTARSGQILSDQAAEAASSYYAADCAAEEILARLRQGELPEGTAVLDSGREGDEWTLYGYTCPVSDVLDLEVQVKVDRKGNYHILQWQVVSVAQWQSDDSLAVWDGE